MRRSLRVWAAASFCMMAVLATAQASPATAENAAVTVGVGDNILTVNGQTVPGAFVTITKDGGVIGTVTADAFGAFGQTFPAQEPGLHQIGAYAQTPSGARTDTITTNVSIAEHATTTVSLFLPSIVVIAKNTLSFQEPLQVSGEASPSCTITLYIDDTGYATAATDSQGKWGIHIPTNGLASGQHSLFARVTDSLGAQSYPSTLRFFTISSPPAEPQIPVVPAPGNNVSTAPQTPTITFPTPGTTWTSPTITVRGTADPGVQVELFDGTNSLGSTLAGPDGTWAITVNLESKDYSLQVRACRGNVCSELSGPLRFSSQPASTGTGLMIETQKTLLNGTQNQPLPIQAIIKGGRPPYTIMIDWGDGRSDTYEQAQHKIDAAHIYNKPGNFASWLNVEDSEGRNARIYFTAYINTEGISLPTALLWAGGGLSIVFVYPFVRYIWHRTRRKHRD